MTEECSKCGKEFDSERGLHIHQTQKHGNNTQDIVLSLDKQEFGLAAFGTGLIVGLMFVVGFLSGMIVSDSMSPQTQVINSDQLNDTPGSEEGGGKTNNQEDLDVSSLKSAESFPYDVDIGIGSENLSWDGTNVELDGRPYIGDAEADVTMIGYEDYFCPYCTGFHNPDFAAENGMNSAFGDIVENHVATGEIKYYFKNFPVVGGERPAEVSECFLEHGDAEAFWTFNHNHYQNSDQLQKVQQQNPDRYDEVMKSWAEQMNVEASGFEVCIDNSEKASTVQDHANEAASLGASATPTQFIEGEMIEGAQPYSSYRPVIEDKLGQ